MTDFLNPDDDAGAGVTILDFFTYLVGDEVAAAAREQHCGTVASALENVASWLAVDAWIGAGDAPDTSVANPTTAADPGRRRSFIAAGLVAQISSELVSGALLLLRNDNEYAASTLIRQLVECEYLLRAFRLDFAEAARWHDANDSEQWDFKPSKLRKIGGFKREEYSHHCESGGHPHPRGRQLLEIPRAMNRLGEAVAGESAGLDITRALWLDFTFHCDRTWRALLDLLAAEHARFEHVGRTMKSINEVAESRAAWENADALALNAGLVLDALNADPSTLLSDLLTAEPDDESVDAM